MAIYGNQADRIQMCYTKFESMQPIEVHNILIKALSQIHRQSLIYVRMEYNEFLYQGPNLSDGSRVSNLL